MKTSRQLYRQQEDNFNANGESFGTISYKKQGGSKQKSIIEELQKMIIESVQENKRLNNTILKMQQKEKNTILFYQSKIQELQMVIENYRLKIESFQNQRGKKGSNMMQSKINKSNMKYSCKFSAEQNNQNINTLNIINQPCNNRSCISKVQNINRQCSIINLNLDHLLKSMQIRQFNQKGSTQKQQWSKMLQIQKSKRKEYQRKNSLTILKNIQSKIDTLQKSIDNIVSQKQITKPLKEAIKSIKIKQQSLVRIPFLEKININERLDQYKNIVNECRQRQKRIITLIHQD